METIAFRLNGKETRVSAIGDTPVLFVLRNDLGLQGTRLGCGEGQCQSCTILVDGRPTNACTLPARAIAGTDVETVESLSAAEPPHPLLESFIAEQAGQCGYCLAGILMRATALLRANPRPSRSEIADALDGHLCRCGAHVRIIRAIERAAVAGGKP